MYKAYWGLTIKPFQNTPDPRFIYYTAQHQDARLKLEYAIKEDLGAAVLSGVFGCGKTTLLYTLLKELNPERYQTVYITHPMMDPIELVMSILSALGDTNLPQKRNEVFRNVIIDRLRNILMNQAREGKKTIVIIDEAHLLTDPAIFEELRLLLNFQLADKFLLTLILSGQPDLRHKIENLPQLEQRVSVKCYLTSLNREDTESYIWHRLKIAGMNREVTSIFTPGAIDRIYEYSGGIPRRINRLCNLTLLAGFTQGLPLIDEKIVEEQAQGLGAGELTTPPEAPQIPAGPRPASLTPLPPSPPIPLPPSPPTPPRPRPSGALPRLDDESSRDLYGALLLLAETFFNQVKLGEVLNMQPAIGLINRVIEKMASGDQTLLALAMKPVGSSVDSPQNYLAVHSVNVAIIAIRVGLIQKRDKASLFRLGLAGLLHDIGMIESPMVSSLGRPLIPPKVKTAASGAPYISRLSLPGRPEKKIKTLSRQRRLKGLVILLLILVALFMVAYLLDSLSKVE